MSRKATAKAKAITEKPPADLSDAIKLRCLWEIADKYHASEISRTLKDIANEDKAKSEPAEPVSSG